MSTALAQAKSDGVTHVIFGDLYLEDIRAYRVARLSEVGMSAVFPLWQRPTAGLAREMIEAGMSAHLATVDLAKLPQSFCGRRYDEALLSDLPGDVDPCGENGEFHSFVTAGPMFDRRIAVTVGETVIREGFAYTDLLPA
jgi:diphthamide synthase (EF-2-diphthine--ammonia ligase)